MTPGLFAFLFGLLANPLSAAPPVNTPALTIAKEDLILQESTEGGYDLWVRKKAQINSILLTESTDDPQKKLHIYALRTASFNPINGNEQRLIDGKFITANTGIIDSTPETHPILGQAFHLFIPYIVEYGYQDTRNGKIQISVGSFLNIKAFAKPYGDWTGLQQDNPFTIQLELEQTIKPTGNFLQETIREYSAIAEKGGGQTFLIPAHEELSEKIRELLEQESRETLDMVIALDTTQSMTDELPYLKKVLVPLLTPLITRFKQFRLGILYYKDYYELYLVKPFPFTDKISEMQRTIEQAQPHGGKEIPEAVYEALNSALDYYPWAAAARLILLIGDAPPHPLPHDKNITLESVAGKAREKGVIIHTFILTVD